MSNLLVAPAEPAEREEAAELLEVQDANRRRFTKAMLAGIAVASPLYLWVLWGGHLDPLRSYFPYNALLISTRLRLGRSSMVIGTSPVDH